ncbi:MAG: hypothetical protein ABI867_32275 [Kofleriaceae bacterium]
MDGLAETVKPAFAEDPRVTALLEERWQAGCVAWPAFSITASRFAAEVARRLGPDATPARLEALRAPDVYLAIACGDGDEAAIAACVALIAKEVAVAASKTSATPTQAADVAANLRRVLFVDEPPRPAAVREFSGRGDLKSYVRVMAIRDLIRAVAAGRREIPTETEALLEQIVPIHDPELSFLRAQYTDVVDAAVRAAIASLDDRGRALLRYQLVERWNVDQVGRAYNVHRATAARWIAAVRSELGDKIRVELAARLKIPIGEVDSIVKLVRSRVDVSLDRVL